MNLTFDETIATPLCSIMGHHKSDKGHVDIKSSWHNYTTVYYSLFKDMQDQPLRLFELGLGTNNPAIPSNMGVGGRPGASLYGWSEFFPFSTIYGADIDREILFQTDRIKTFFCDQTNPTIIQSLWNQPELEEAFDIIIEDGLHTFEANVCFFENSIHKVKPNGYYIIEDILFSEMQLFLAKIEEWKTRFPSCSFDMIAIPSTRNPYDNNLLVIRKG
jgi:hypothetical protein